MNWAKRFIILSLQLIFAHSILAQTTSEPKLFQEKEPLRLKIKYSSKKLRSDTNDSTYMSSMLYLEKPSSAWDSMPVKIRARGDFRRKYCYYVPLKLKLSGAYSRGTVFEGHKKLKWVLPCHMGMESGDYIIKEYLAYRIFETISAYHFKVRLIALEFDEIKGRRIKQHQLKTFLIEDIDKAAERYMGHELKRDINPMNHDAYEAIKQAMFQFMIGNTDFSVERRHNAKLLFADGKIIALPYDFDMSGLVDTDYSTVSNIQNIPTKITDVKERAYKGYPRDAALMTQLRQEYLKNKIEILNIIAETEEYFKDPVQFRVAEEYIRSFFQILENDKKYQRFITSRIREN